MPRENRHFIPAHVWRITHRCHKKEFLLKFPVIVRDGLIGCSKHENIMLSSFELCCYFQSYSLDCERHG